MTLESECCKWHKVSHVGEFISSLPEQVTNSLCFLLGHLLLLGLFVDSLVSCWSKKEAIASHTTYLRRVDHHWAAHCLPLLLLHYLTCLPLSKQNPTIPILVLEVSSGERVPTCGYIPW